VPGKSNKFPVGPSWFTIEEVAEQLKVTPRTVWQEIHRGNLTASRVGHQWRISRENLDIYLAPVTP
jgi:putative molybdopterin biosynthesis protein